MERFAFASKQFHFYNRKEKVRSYFGSLRFGTGEAVYAAAEMCELLATSFSSVFVAEALQIIQGHQEFDRMFDDVILSPMIFVEVLSRLDSSSVAGSETPDGLQCAYL